MLQSVQPVKITVESDSEDPNGKRLVIQLPDGTCYYAPLDALTA